MIQLLPQGYKGLMVAFGAEILYFGGGICKCHCANAMGFPMVIPPRVNSTRRAADIAYS